MAPECLDVAPECRHLEGRTAADDCHRAVLYACGYRLEPTFSRQRHDLVGLGGRCKIDLAHGTPKQRIAHGAADRARLDARRFERLKHAHGRRAPQPFGILE
jgi:hypothetical protein